MTHREYEYMKPSKMPEWMKDFAEKEAVKKEGNYIDHINEILNPQSKINSVEAMVDDLRKRVGLDLLKEASIEDPKVTLIKGLLSIANKLDAQGKYKEAKKVDIQIKILAEESKKESKKESRGKTVKDPEGLENIINDPKFREMLQFIDGIVESRGGKITSVSLQAMIENEKGFDVSNPQVFKYIQDKIKAVRDNSPEVFENMGNPFGSEIQEKDKEANNQVFDIPETNL